MSNRRRKKLQKVYKRKTLDLEFKKVKGQQKRKHKMKMKEQLAKRYPQRVKEDPADRPKKLIRRRHKNVHDLILAGYRLKEIASITSLGTDAIQEVTKTIYQDQDIDIAQGKNWFEKLQHQVRVKFDYERVASQVIRKHCQLSRLSDKDLTEILVLTKEHNIPADVISTRYRHLSAEQVTAIVEFEKEELATKIEELPRSQNRIQK